MEIDVRVACAKPMYVRGEGEVSFGGSANILVIMRADMERVVWVYNVFGRCSSLA